jgi:hypothetical protein
MDEIDPDSTAFARMIRLPANALVVLIRVYKHLFSQLFTGSCRFVPSCSSYAEEAVLRHGAIGGSWLTLRRLARCHPFCEGGLDQVPRESFWRHTGRRLMKLRGAR